MSDFDVKGVFDSFYDKLILRDLVGKVVPGSLFLLAVLFAAFGVSVIDSILSKMTFALWIFVGGLCWLVGFALQYMGEALKLLRQNPHGKSKKSETRETFYPHWAYFQKSATTYERLHAERLNVIKEACGNAAISIIAGVAFVGFRLWWRGEFLSVPEMPLLALALVLAFCFWRMHIIHVERYGELILRTIGKSKELVPSTQ